MSEERKPTPLIQQYESEEEAKKADLRQQLKERKEEMEAKGIVPKPLIAVDDGSDPGATNSFLILLNGQDEEGREFHEWDIKIGRQEAYDYIKDSIEFLDLVNSFIVSEKNTIEERIPVIEFLRHVLESGKIEDPGFDPDDYLIGDYVEEDSEE